MGFSASPRCGNRLGSFVGFTMNPYPTMVRAGSTLMHHGEGKAATEMLRKTAPTETAHSRSNGTGRRSRSAAASPISLLPPEVLDLIFVAFIWQHDERSWRILLRCGLAPVCRLWEAGTRRLLLHRIRILFKPSAFRREIDALIRRKMEGFWAATRSLHITVPFFHEPHRLSELVELFGDTLQSLTISGHWDLMEGKNYAGLPPPQERSADTPLTFPEMRSLHLTAVPAPDALSILLACDLQKITHLELSAFRRNVDEPFLDGVVLPNLRTFVLGFALAGLESTREDFSKATPSLKSLQLVVAPDSLGPLASHLGGKAPRQLEELTVWIWDPSEWIRDPEHPDLKPLLGLVKKKGWESGFTLSGRTGMLSWSLVQPSRINDMQSAPKAISSG